MKEFPVLSPDAFNAFAFFGGILALKLFFMSHLTALHRFRTMIFISPEDMRFFRLEFTGEKNDRIERVRRAHRNDLENILPFFFVGFFYCYTDPGTNVATILFLVFTVARFLHTLVYAVIVIPQPARVISFLVAMYINVYMAVRIIITFSQHVRFDN